MMKQKYFALFLACLMAVALTGCSASRDKDSRASAAPTNSAVVDNNAGSSAGVNDGAHSSAGMDDGAYYSDNAGDNTSGGNGQNNVSGSSSPSNGGDVMDDIGDAAGDLARGAGNVVRGAGDAIGDAANDVGRAMR